MAEPLGAPAAVPVPSLLGQCQRLFENTHAAAAGVNLENFVVGATRYRHLAERSSRPAGSRAADDFGEGARFFYYLSGRDLRMAIFYSDELIERLEAHDPRRELGETNVLEFVVFLEELSHALHPSLAFQEDRRRLLRRSFPAELELQAKIDVFLALVFFLERLEGGRGLSRAARAWILRNLFDRWSESYQSPVLARRYALALRLGRRAVAHLDATPSTQRLDEVRRLRALSLREKRRLLES
ncbi:MAG: hypothetical protein ABR599_06280 [Gemmatimonadota bacterium]